MRGLARGAAGTAASGAPGWGRTQAELPPGGQSGWAGLASGAPASGSGSGSGARWPRGGDRECWELRPLSQSGRGTGLAALLQGGRGQPGKHVRAAGAGTGLLPSSEARLGDGCRGRPSWRERGSGASGQSSDGPQEAGWGRADQKRWSPGCQIWKTECPGLPDTEGADPSPRTAGCTASQTRSIWEPEVLDADCLDSWVPALLCGLLR